jgi:hypothetical protein
MNLQPIGSPQLNPLASKEFTNARMLKQEAHAPIPVPWSFQRRIWRVRVGNCIVLRDGSGRGDIRLSSAGGRGPRPLVTASPGGARRVAAVSW